MRGRHRTRPPAISRLAGWRRASPAEDAGLSRPHLYKLFRERADITPNVYLNTLRMERAIDQPTRIREPVTSIGSGLGFASQASVARFFTADVGIPPADDRRVAHLAA